ncbi:MAG TPA: cytochrome c peroxidase [Candidatus Angelobacter sp.]
MNRQLRRSYKFILMALAVACGVFFTFAILRAQNAPASAKKVIPELPLQPLSAVPNPPIPGLSNYIADQTAAIALGKALFWDQQVGSDGVQACASCHFNAGADSRAFNQIDPGLRDQDPSSPNFNMYTLGVLLGNSYYPNYQLHAGNPTAGFGGYHDGDFPLNKPLADSTTAPFNTGVDHHDVISSQGVFARTFNSITPGNGVDNSTSTPDANFSYPDPSNPGQLINTRKVEPRNTPSMVNAVFNFRNFWDGRARNICNGANPFGERDANSHFFSASTTTAVPVAGLVRLQNSALCSQALGPALSPFEMSAAGRSFPLLGRKLLSVTPLGNQTVHPQDSVLGHNSKSPQHGINVGYAAMIQAAFQPAWWQSAWHICVASDGSETLINPTATPAQTCPAGTQEYTQMEYNFSLFWGLAIQAYESTQRADQTPFDQYLVKQSVFTIPADNVTQAFSFKLPKGITPYTVSVQAFNPALDKSDQDVFAFDNGFGGITGIGIVSGTINYSTGQVSLFFELPPPTGFPTKVAYSVGNTPLTTAQLRGLLIFETKAKCVVCHGGPELTNASVSHVSQSPMERMLMGDFSVRVYDSGFYHIGVRPGHEDIGLADKDGIPTSGLPLSDAATAQLSVCAGGTPPIIPGRPGDGIGTAPLSCTEPISSYGTEKTPGLRNLALTAPYFHNGGQLTLEQVVEFYNRGGDFPLATDEPTCPATFSEINCLMDPNVQPLGLTLQEKTDLVDFLRNGLLDARTLNQSAPFDHPSLTVPNGHPVDANGYPVPDPNHPGQAQDLYMTIPANGKFGALPLPPFLQNVARP